MKTFKSFTYFYISILITLISISTIYSENYRDAEEREEYQKTNEDDERNEFSRQWEKEMSDFDPDFVYMIPLDYKSSDVFYQNITIAPFKLRGAILVDEEKKESIDFTIESPSGQIMYKKTSPHCIFNLEIHEKGVYKFYFDNKYENTEIRVTFTLNSGNNNVLKKTDLDFSNQKANLLLEFIEKLRMERKLKKNTEYNRSLSIIMIVFYLIFYLFILILSLELQKFNKTFFTYSVIETIFLFAVSVIQFYYLKNSLEGSSTILKI